jgi:hypothetical protein
MARGRWIQIELKAMQGGETWWLVRRGDRSFKVPGAVSLDEVMLGVARGWGETPAVHVAWGGTTRVPNPVLGELLNRPSCDGIEAEAPTRGRV